LNAIQGTRGKLLDWDISPVTKIFRCVTTQKCVNFIVLMYNVPYQSNETREMKASVSSFSFPSE